MFAFAESLKRQGIKLINPNANIRLLSVKVSAQISDRILQPCTNRGQTTTSLWFV